MHSKHNTFLKPSAVIDSAVWRHAGGSLLIHALRPTALMKEVKQELGGIEFILSSYQS